MNGSTIVVQALEHLGVDTVFGLPGGQTVPIYAAIGQSRTIRHVLVRDERSGAYAADAYARATGRLGVCDATVGPGATKLPSGLFEALNASVPVLALLSGIETDRFNYYDKGRSSQGIDQLGMLKPVTKAVFRVTSANRIAETLRIAAVTACSGRPGPVAVELPVDVLNTEVKDPVEFFDVIAEYPLYPMEPPTDAVAQAAELLTKAQRPVIVAGGGVLLSHAESELAQLAQLHQIPVVTTYTGKGAIADSEPMALGFTGSTGIPVNEDLIRSADVVFLVGMKSSQNTTFGWTFPTRDQTVIHCDIDPEDMNRVFPTAVCLVGDARLTLRKLLREMTPTTLEVARTPWVEKIHETRHQWERMEVEETGSTAVPIKPQRVMRAVQEILKPDMAVVADASFASGWVAMFLRQSTPGRQMFFPRGSAGLGWGLPAGIGVAMTRRFRSVIVVAGDGGFAYSLGELAAVKQHHLPVVSVVLNNSTLAWIKWGEVLAYDVEPPSTNFEYVDFGLAAHAVGLPFATVTEPDQLETELGRLIDGGGGGVLNVVTAWDEAPVWKYRQLARERDQGRSTVLEGYAVKSSSGG